MNGRVPIDIALGLCFGVMDKQDGLCLQLFRIIWRQARYYSSGDGWAFETTPAKNVLRNKGH